MILYNTLMGFCAGLGMLLTVSLIQFSKEHGTDLESRHNRGFGAAYLVLGVPLTVLAGAMTLTWPLHVNPPINIAFAEPSLILGMLMVVAGWFMVSRSGPILLMPILVVVAATGLMLLTIASAILSYNLVGDAPPQEPITGQFTGWENTAFGLAYALAGVGCLLLPLAMTKSVLRQISLWALGLSGLFFLLFSVLNYRTHIGFLINLERGTRYRW